MKRIVILISGRGSNLQSILDAKLDARIAAVISNNPAARGIDVARTFGVETAVIDHRAFPDRASFDAALVDKASSYRPDLLVLAGFMRVLSEGFIKRFSGELEGLKRSDAVFAFHAASLATRTPTIRQIASVRSARLSV